MSVCACEYTHYYARLAALFFACVLAGICTTLALGGIFREVERKQFNDATAIRDFSFFRDIYARTRVCAYRKLARERESVCVGVGYS